MHYCAVMHMHKCTCVNMCSMRVVVCMRCAFFFQPTVALVGVLCACTFSQLVRVPVCVYPSPLSQARSTANTQARQACSHRETQSGVKEGQREEGSAQDGDMFDFFSSFFSGQLGCTPGLSSPSCCESQDNSRMCAERGGRGNLGLRGVMVPDLRRGVPARDSRLSNSLAARGVLLGGGVDAGGRARSCFNDVPISRSLREWHF